MGNKQIQQDRMKKYFIDAAKKLIANYPRSELSVRKIAGDAGYSYATIYNYFDNLDHLLWYVIIDILDELALALQSVLDNDHLNEKQKLKLAATTYTDYFLDHSNEFDLLFLSPPDAPPSDVRTKLHQPSIQDTITHIVTTAVGDKSKTDLIGAFLTGALHGYLLFAISLHHYTKNNLHLLISQSIDLLLQ